VLVTLGLDSKRRVRRLLRDLSDVRKRAGKVRDMDVLTSDALSIKPHGDRDCQVQLLEYLGARRKKYAGKLRRAVKNSSPHLHRDLKRTERRVEDLFKLAASDPEDSEAMAATMAKALQLSSDLNRPARLNKSNLHPYRLKVKELRNVLKLSANAEHEDFVDTLREVKDAIGEWHDWEELTAIAHRVLDHGPSCKLLKHLKLISERNFRKAMALAGRLRTHYLRAGEKPAAQSTSRAASVSESILKATAGIAAP